MIRIFKYSHISILVILLCFVSVQTFASSWGHIKQSKTIRVGVSIFTPWVRLKMNGKVVGFEVDIARKFAKDNHLNIKFVVTHWDTLIPSLASNKYDVIISGLSVSKQRAKKVDFTKYYAVNSDVMMVNYNLRNKKFSTNSRFKIGIVRASTAALYIKKKYPKAKISYYDWYSIEVLSLLEHKVSAVVLPRFLAKCFLYKYVLISKKKKKGAIYTTRTNKLYVLNKGQPIKFFYSAMAVSKGNNQLRTQLNNWILANRGYIQQLYLKWFKTTKYCLYK